jgi:hypothetical protein
MTAWTMCALSTFFLASRFRIRYSKKGRLGLSEYFLIMALLSLFAGTGLLQSTRNEPYAQSSADVFSGTLPCGNATPRLIAAIELLCVTIYCVKASFFAQFKFHKPLYAYVSPRLTRYYWTAVAICGSAFLFTMIVPITLCPSSS